MARGRHTTLLLLALLAPAADAAKKKDKAAKAAKPAAGAKAAGAAETLSAALARGDSLRQAGKYAEAEAAYRAASTLEPTRAEPHFFLGMTTRAADRTDEAMSHYKDALALSPQLAEAHMNVASLLSQMPGREEEALDHLGARSRRRERVGLAHRLELAEGERSDARLAGGGGRRRRGGRGGGGAAVPHPQRRWRHRRPWKR